MNLIMALMLLCATTEGLEEPRLVYPRILQGRSSDGKLMLHVHDELTLNLEQATVAAPQLRVLNEEDGTASVTEMYDGHEINRNLYQDRDQLATVEVKLKETSAEITGIVGPNHRIEPTPTMERSESGLIPHMVYKIQHAKIYDKALSITEEVKGRLFTSRNNQAANRVPQEVVVEVFFVLDRMHHPTFTTDRLALVYLCILLNSANLRMSDMYNPRVRLALTGLEKSSSDDNVHASNTLLHDTETLQKFLTYAQGKKSDFGNPDLVFLVTGRDVATGSNWETSATGIAYIGGVCGNYYVGLGEDQPGLFTGMHTVTHEIGHLLGCVHDGNGPASGFDAHPGAATCPWRHGYIMSYVNENQNHHRFSQCSLQQMRYVLGLRGQSCWNVLSKIIRESKKYPGYRNINLKICQQVFPNKPNVTAQVMIERGNECILKCRYSVHHGYFTRFYETTRDAPDYSSCGGNRYCVRGLCVQATTPRKKVP